MSEIPDSRPRPGLRLTSERREPAVIGIRTCFHYHQPRDSACADEPARVARYHSEVTDFGEFASQPAGYRSVGDLVQRMVRAFGDDAELEVVVRRRRRRSVVPVAPGSNGKSSVPERNSLL